MKLIEKYYDVVKTVSNWKSLPLFLMRMVLAYGFYNPAKMKWNDIDAIAGWFDSMGYPMPTFNAYMAAGTEALGVILLFLGLGTRLISIPLIIVMVVAITTVHMANGFEAGSNGYEIPLYYMIMFVTLVIFGGGKWSLDYFVDKKFKG